MHLLAPVFTRVFSALLALALIASGIVVVVEVFAAWLGAGWTILPDDTAALFQRWEWNDRPVVVTLVIVAVAGLLALLIGLSQRPPLTVPIEGQPDVSYERHALEQSIRRDVERLDGVTKARVRVARGRLVTRVDTNRRLQPDDVKSRVDGRLHEITTARRISLRPDVRLRAPGVDR